MRASILACALLLSAPSLCRADMWATPSPSAFSSEDGKVLLNIVPNQGAEAKGPATATWVQVSQDGTEDPRSEIQLVNTPMEVLPQEAAPEPAR